MDADVDLCEATAPPQQVHLDWLKAKTANVVLLTFYGLVVGSLALSSHPPGTLISL